MAAITSGRWLSVRSWFVLIMALVFVFGSASSYALPEDQKRIYQKNIGEFDIASTGTCTNSSVTSAKSGSTNTNVDYDGKPILTPAQVQAIEQNKSVYEQAANEVKIPWQMLAVVHLRETGLKLDNPNDDGLFQIVTKSYPQGPVNQANFLSMAKDAANFLKSAASSNYQGNQNLGLDANEKTVKDTFFTYNGRASAYSAQAASLGFSATTEGYEGSPYVMNKADAKRDPNKNPTGWGQIKTDGGGVSYPANQDYGAFVVYAALAGISMSGSCSSDISGSTSEKVVALTKKEFAAWEAGELRPETGYKKYSQNRAENWCADFASWIYKQAGYPLIDENEGNVPAVATMESIGKQNGKFTYHDAAGYNPKLGDLVLYGTSHVNIVVAIEGTNITVIGGNQGANGAGFNASKVTSYSLIGSSGGGATGYVSPKE